jgi:hypothetical protein
MIRIRTKMSRIPNTAAYTVQVELRQLYSSLVELVRPFWTYSILFYSILLYTAGGAAAAVLLPGGAGAALLDIFYSILFYSILFYSILLFSILFYSIYCRWSCGSCTPPWWSWCGPSGPILFYSILLFSILFYSILYTVLQVELRQLYSSLVELVRPFWTYSILFYSVYYRWSCGSCTPPWWS